MTAETGRGVTNESGLLEPLAQRLGWTEGQLYTATISAVMAIVLALLAVPPTLREKVAQEVVAPDWIGDRQTEITEESPRSSPDTEPVETDVSFSDPLVPEPTAEAAPSPSGGQPPAHEPPSNPSDDSPPSSGAFRVIKAGYAAHDSGTPLATAGIPRDSVAAASRAGEPNKIAYLLLAGAGEDITLEVVTNSAATNFQELAEIQACVVKSPHWVVGNGDVSIEEAPEFDCTDSTDGVRSEDGTSWTFNVSELGAESLSNGVALVPVAGTPLHSFQVSFRVAAPAAPNP